MSRNNEQNKYSEEHVEYNPDNLKYSVINSIFDQKEKYLIIALTGKVGAGCSTIAGIIQKSLDQMNLSYSQPGIEGMQDDSERECRVMQRFYSWHQKSFHLIRVRDIIASFLLERDDVWNGLLKKIDDENRVNDIKEELMIAKKALLINLFDREDENAFNKFNKSIWEDKIYTGDAEDEHKKRYLYVKTWLPQFGEKVHNLLGDKFTEIFQDCGNRLRFFGTLSSEEAELKASLLQKNKFSKIRKDLKKRRHGEWKEDVEVEYIETQNQSETVFTIAKRINRCIKILGYSGNDNVKRPVSIVIDSMKNIFESNYLKERYTAFYLISASREEELRMQEIRRKKVLYSQKTLDFIDLNERPNLARKKLKQFAKLFKTTRLYSTDDDKLLKKYLKYIENGNEDELLKLLMEQKNRDEIKNQLAEMFKLSENKWDEKKDSSYKEIGISETLFAYYCYTLEDPLRVFLYVSGLYPFFLQDVETCIQNADIFLTNNEKTDEKRRLCQNVVRYISLMMHPGLVPPTAVEKCMQLAYTAKVNSGCISRQVGAVVTDAEYQILSMGWNDVPCGQTSCVLRNLIDVSRGLDAAAYSDYEIGKHSGFKHFVKKYQFEHKEVEERLEGLPACYCFKDLNEAYTGEKNPMESRAMHGEEKALLLCDQNRVKDGYLFTTSSPCIMCAKNAKEHHIKKIYYIEPYPGISQSHVCDSGDFENRAQFELFEGAIGRAYTQLYTPVISYKDELKIRGMPEMFKIREGMEKNLTAKLPNYEDETLPLIKTKLRWASSEEKNMDKGSHRDARVDYTGGNYE